MTLNVLFLRITPTQLPFRPAYVALRQESGATELVWICEPVQQQNTATVSARH
ncbi:hypothetical protein [Streptomyces griseus]|uniref:hypothetical protein n=1 Tax=Streptomyces griseus TaxID=1911 RepID=UPI000AF18CAC|nr:hypothetical protein [Streptomyces griseus]